MKGKIALNQAFDYVESVTESDISKPDGVRRDPDTARRIMRSYARLQGTQSANTVIAPTSPRTSRTRSTRIPSIRTSAP